MPSVTVTMGSRRRRGGRLVMGMVEVEAEAEDGAEVDAGGLEYEYEDDEWAGEEVGTDEEWEGEWP